ncbi:MAG: serine protease [Verrucomicrobiaceae bacterium]|nr:serine protease [Verrucomicrobiaceae bacterium]
MTHIFSRGFADALSIALALGFVAGDAVRAAAETPPLVYSDRRTDATVMKRAGELRDAGSLPASDVLLPQLNNKKCALILPVTHTQKLAGRDLWAAARQSYLRVGWFYLCSKCSHWHLDLAGGYVITADGVAVTCHHVAETPEKFIKGHFIAATDDGSVLPVTAILAANAKSDVCIVRLKADAPLVPLPLSDAARPGDIVYCFSDPMGFRGYFSQGIVNRYYRELPRRRDAKNGSSVENQPLSLNVSTDWAPGSSGAAVIDECGNAIGHVARILPVEEEPRKKKKTAGPDEPASQHEDRGTLMVMHNAVPAQEVLALIEKK